MNERERFLITINHQIPVENVVFWKETIRDYIVNKLRNNILEGK